MLAGMLLAARLLAAHFGSFFEQDEISLASGIAAIERGETSGLYRYGVQVGYYRIVAFLAQVLGGDPLIIPPIMIVLSAMAGTAIPLLGLAMFRHDLEPPERWLVVAILAANPILWMSSRYGNTAMPAAALVVASFATLSNRPTRRAEVAALALFGAAILTRADAVLAAGGAAALLGRHHGGWRPAGARIGMLGLGVAMAYGGLLLVDPHMAEVLQTVGRHMSDQTIKTRFWEYLLWAMSPIPLALAVLGLREAVVARPWLAAIIVAWSLPVLAFYFSATTTSRYFLLAVVPLAVAAAIGVTGLVALAHSYRWAVLAGVVALLFVHLLVALGHFAPGRARNLLEQGSVETADGPQWTGAFLYKSYLGPGFRSLQVWRPRFGGIGSPNLAERSAAVALESVAAGDYFGRRIVFVYSGWNGHLAQFYAHAAGARFAAPLPGEHFPPPAEITLGGGAMLLFHVEELLDALGTVPVAPGDELWVLGQAQAVAAVVRRAPSDTVLTELAPWSSAPRLARFAVRRADAARVIDDVVEGLRRVGLISATAVILSRWHTRLSHGYPTPWLGRDEILGHVQPALEALDIYSRGRFGAWRYEVSNQDHSAMQGVEVVDRLLCGTSESTVSGHMGTEPVAPLPCPSP